MSNDELKLYTIPDQTEIPAQDSSGTQSPPSSQSTVLSDGQVKLAQGTIQSANFQTGTAGWQLTPNSAQLNVSTAIHSLDIPDTTTANSFHVASNGDTWWGATTLGSALASILRTGVATFTSITLSGSVAISGIANNTSTDIALLEKTHDLVFSVTDADTIAWTSGTVTLSNGRTFSISSGNTGNMVALTYIYIDPAISSTVLQTTTTAATGMGANKILLGVAQNHTVTASFIPYGPGQPLIDGSNIGALSIVAGNIAASTITAGKISVSQLSAIAADMGTLTTGVINLSSGTANLHSGQSAYNTGTGFWLEYNGGTPRFSIGDPTGNYMLWTGTALEVTDSKIINSFTTSESVTAGQTIAIGDGVGFINSQNSTVTTTESTTTTVWISQAFTTTAGCLSIELVNISFSNSLQTTDIKVSIRADDGGGVSTGKPTGADIGSKVATQTFSTSGFYNFTFASPVAVSPSTVYHVVVRVDSGGNTESINRANNTSVGTNRSSNSGSTWAANNGQIGFQIQEIDSTSGRICRASAGLSTARANNFIGFAYETKGSGVACRVAMTAVATGLSGLTAGTTYYLSNTYGSLATSAGGVSRKVGVALSSTSLLIKHDNV